MGEGFSLGRAETSRGFGLEVREWFLSFLLSGLEWNSRVAATEGRIHHHGGVQPSTASSLPWCEPLLN